MSTIFKKIIDREIKSEIVYEDQNVICINDINPQAPIHLLIIPKKIIETINDIDIDNKHLIADMVFAAKKIAKNLKIDKKGYRLVFNCNDDGGQTVYHIHMHFLAGRKFTWPPG
ncbi:MAG: histidine triad nucleotide-binding protein [Candidatus Marinimicrobia bacterium]|nr:histidine triad nucleotide-binding protein [Candidatus Neomarinimicrobiota bacterium]